MFNQFSPTKNKPMKTVEEAIRDCYPILFSQSDLEGVTFNFDQVQALMKYYAEQHGAEQWTKADRPLSEYPVGTKAKAIGGGYWIKNDRGWKWCTGATFPNVGGDWTGEISLPQAAEQDREFDVDFGGSLMARINVINGKIEISAAMDGWGNALNLESVTVTPLSAAPETKRL